jgi:hypothetical protein
MTTTDPLADIRDLAHDVGRASDHARTLAWDLVRAGDVASGLTRSLAYDLVSASVLARALVREPNRGDLAIELARDIVRASDLAFVRARDPVRASDRARAHDLARELGRASNLASKLVGADDVGLARMDDLASDLIRASDHAGGREHSQDPVVSVSSDGKHEEDRMVRSADRLVAVAARMLPASDRARYEEEYRSELWEIAHAGQSIPRIRQLLYAVRQAASSYRLRSELLAPRRRKVSP